MTVGGTDVHLLVDNSRGVRVGHNISIVLNTDKVQFFDPGTELSLLWS